MKISSLAITEQLGFSVAATELLGLEEGQGEPKEVSQAELRYIGGGQALQAFV